MSVCLLVRLQKHTFKHILKLLKCFVIFLFSLCAFFLHHSVSAYFSYFLIISKSFASYGYCHHPCLHFIYTVLYNFTEFTLFQIYKQFSFFCGTSKSCKAFPRKIQLCKTLDIPISHQRLANIQYRLTYPGN